MSNSECPVHARPPSVPHIHKSLHILHFQYGVSGQNKGAAVVPVLSAHLNTQPGDSLSRPWEPQAEQQHVGVQRVVLLWMRR